MIPPLWDGDGPHMSGKEGWLSAVWTDKSVHVGAQLGWVEAAVASAREIPAGCQLRAPSQGAHCGVLVAGQHLLTSLQVDHGDAGIRPWSFLTPDMG